MAAARWALDLSSASDLVLRDPRHLLADVAHLHQEAVQAGVLGGAAEGGLVQVRRAGGHHDAGQAGARRCPASPVPGPGPSTCTCSAGRGPRRAAPWRTPSTLPRPPCRQCCCRNGKRKPRSAAIHRRSCCGLQYFPSGFVNQFAQVDHAEPAFRPDRLDRVLEHDQVLGAGDDEALHAGQGDRFLDAVFRRPLLRCPECLSSRSVRRQPRSRSCWDRAAAFPPVVAPKARKTRRGGSYTPLNRPR